MLNPTGFRCQHGRKRVAALFIDTVDIEPPFMDEFHAVTCTEVRIVTPLCGKEVEEFARRLATVLMYAARRSAVETGQE